MKHLADLIRKGLDTPSVIEDPGAFGIEKLGDRYRADITGLALIGMLGLENAAAPFAKFDKHMIGPNAREELRSWVRMELGVSDDEMAEINSAHVLGRMAHTIADALENEASLLA